MKYPKTQHIYGSKECDIGLVPVHFVHDYPQIKNNMVVEEKMDGMGIGLYFSKEWHVQFRGHSFTENYATPKFKNIFKWIKEHDLEFLGENILYGEWLEFTHTVEYFALPDYFIEYDLFDKKRNIFLDTPSRHKILNSTGITSAKTIQTQVDPKSLVNAFELALGKLSTQKDIYPEGYYIKEEKNGAVVNRYKFIRKSFIESVISSKQWNTLNKNRLLV